MCVTLPGNLKHIPFFGTGETWETYEPRFEEALSWLQVRGEAESPNTMCLVDDSKAKMIHVCLEVITRGLA